MRGILALGLTLSLGGAQAALANSAQVGACSIAGFAAEAAMAAFPNSALEPGGPNITVPEIYLDGWSGKPPPKSMVPLSKGGLGGDLFTCADVRTFSGRSKDKPDGSRLYASLPVISRDGKSAVLVARSVGAVTAISVLVHLERRGDGWVKVGSRFTSIG